MSALVSYTAKGTVVEGSKGWKGGHGKLVADTEPWLLHCKLSISNGSISSHTTKESKVAEDQSSKEETREVKTTTLLPKLQQQVRYEYQKLLRSIACSAKEIDTGLYLLHNKLTFHDNYAVDSQLKLLEAAIRKLNDTLNTPKATLTFSMIKLEKEIKTFRITSDLDSSKIIEGAHASTASVLQSATRSLGTDLSSASEQVIIEAFPNVQPATVEDDDVLI